jgi:preprotein translocase SecE subunit
VFQKRTSGAWDFASANGEIRIMAIGIYKRGQGHWTRQMSTIAGAVLILMGALWLAERMQAFNWPFPLLYAQAGAGVLWTAVLGGLLYNLVWRRVRSVDFLVATEGEMKKVNWSTKQEVAGSTVVVICFAIGVSLFCKFFDLIFVFFFSSIDVLETPS